MPPATSQEGAALASEAGKGSVEAQEVFQGYGAVGSATRYSQEAIRRAFREHAAPRGTRQISLHLLRGTLVRCGGWTDCMASEFLEAAMHSLGLDRQAHSIDYDLFLDWLFNDAAASGRGGSGKTVTSSPVARAEPAKAATGLQGVSVYHLRTVLLEQVCEAGLSRQARLYDLAHRGALSLPDDATGTAYVDRLRGKDHVGQATLLLSCVWGYTIGDITDTLSNYCRDRNLEPCRTYVWICCLCVNQHRMANDRARGGVLAADNFKFEFAERAWRIGCVLSPLAPWGSTSRLLRIWCDFVMMGGALAASQSGTEDLIPQGRIESVMISPLDVTGLDELRGIVANLDIQGTGSFSMDKIHVAKSISGPGSSKLDLLLHKHLEAWVLSTCETSLEQCDATGDMANQLSMRMCLKVAQLLRSLGLLDDAENSCQQALLLHAMGSSPESPDQAALLTELGLVIGRQGDLKGAAEELEEARGVFERTGALATPEGVSLLGAIARLRMEQGDLGAALRACSEAKQAFTRRDQGARSHVEVLVNSGISRTECGDLDGALCDFDEALKICEQSRLIVTPLGGALWTRVGIARRRRGNWEGAARALDEAFRICQETGTMVTPAGALLMENLGQVRRERKDYSGALEAFAQAQHICEQVGVRESIHLVRLMTAITETALLGLMLG